MRPLHALIVGSAPVERAHLQALAGTASMLICADGGADAALEAGLHPDMVVGDMDSISPARRVHLERLQIPVHEHPAEKDQTDMELALQQALAAGAGRITLTGALGGRRVDHAAGNLLLLTVPELQDVEAAIDEIGTYAFVVWSTRGFAGRVGEYVSLLPISATVDGVVTSGLRYALRDEPLVRGRTRGVSNELSAETATISIAGGLLLVIHERLHAGPISG